MDWELQLIATYVYICDAWQKGINGVVRRHSNNNNFLLEDEEVASIYLFGIMSGQTTTRGIYEYTDRHLREWFPQLGGYESFNYRLNRISDGFVSMSEYLVENSKKSEKKNWVVDSLPIVMAGPRRSDRAKVAKELADKGFCASKGLYFYGVKLHCVGCIQNKTIPMPTFIGLAPASSSDHKMFEQISPVLKNSKTFADKAYADADHKKELEQKQNVDLLTPIKKLKNQFSFPGSDVFSSWVSSVRRPIESLFNWLQEKTNIQYASKVRSSSGLIVHIFGRISAALMMIILA